jgi:outer membrane protein OmpA-like peptidoglycan-associated protein
MNNISIAKVSFLVLFISSVLYGGTYDDIYSLAMDTDKQDQRIKNKFMDGEFDEIIRFDALLFNDSDELSSDSKEYLKEIIKKTKEYIDGGKKISITVIGHTDRPTDSCNEAKAASNTYAANIEDAFSYSLDSNESKKLSKNYAQFINKKLLDNDIDENIISVEYRKGKDIAYSDSMQSARELSNRVMVSIYVDPKEDIDSDKDGVFDTVDRCDGTPREVKVDRYGCPVDSDGDGVVDYKDRCKDTMIGVSVDKQGCPLDSDGDGVADYKDNCPDTIKGLKVDLHGCPLNKTLALIFKTNSAKILQSSYHRIVEFAEFLKQNPAYKAEVIGHTDSTGKAWANMILSKARAKSVRDALVSEGIKKSRLTFRGRGELEPIMSNRTAKGRKANRRIEVKIKY